MRSNGCDVNPEHVNRQDGSSFVKAPHAAGLQRASFNSSPVLINAASKGRTGKEVKTEERKATAIALP